MSTQKSTNDGTCQFSIRRNYHQQHHDDYHSRNHFLVHSCRRHFISGADGSYGKKCKSKDVSFCWWLFCCLLTAQLLFATQTFAQTVDNIVYNQRTHTNSLPPPPPSLSTPNRGDIAGPFSSEHVEENLLQNKGRRQYVSFSDIDKEVGMIWYPQNPPQIERKKKPNKTPKL